MHKESTMEEVAEGLWGLSDYHENRGEIAKSVKCLEAICQSEVSFSPIVEVKTRLRIASILLHHSHNANHAKTHLERAVSNFSILQIRSISFFFLIDFVVVVVVVDVAIAFEVYT